jgi:hypothetical protein
MNRRQVFAALGSAFTIKAQGTWNLRGIERERVLGQAKTFLGSKTPTVTAAKSARSAGGEHDFFSEGDYWWPDPAKPGGPYVQRDGMTNPDNFVEHRKFLMQLSVQMPALTAAWVLTKDRRYAAHAAAYVRAWFVTPATRMNPNLQYAQAISGRTTGRGTGIIDTIHLVEVVQAIPQLGAALSAVELSATKAWFAEYLEWMRTSKNGIEERDTKNNHATCWWMQAAAFAKFTGNEGVLAECRERFKRVLLPTQIEADGSQPLELRRTKPYGYCLFNLEAFAALAQILSTPADNLFTYTTADGRGLAKAIEYMQPFIADKTKWNKPADVMYFDQWPMRQTALLFGANAYGRQDYFETWKKLPADSPVDEVIRNFFIRQPLLWLA